MWMMGYNEHGGEVNLNESSFNANSRRLRPLIPRPLPSNSINNLNSNHPYFFSPYQHLGEQNKVNSTSSGGTANTTPQVVASSRWNPTPEQLRALEELYRRGTRTPSAEQIQHITAQLRRYGKIEGKNVFYWFQNHKARERQKRRRQMESTSAPPVVVDELEIFTHRDNIKELGSVFEVEQTKNWPLSSNGSTSLAEDSHVSIQRAVSENNNISNSNNNNNNNNNKVVAGSIVSAMQGSECVRTDGWFQLGDLELQNRRISNNSNNNTNNMNRFVERNATWQMQLSCPDPLLLTHLINTPSTTNNTSNIIISTTNNNNNSSRNSIKSTTISSNPQNGLIISSCNNLLNGCFISQIEDNYSDDTCPRDESQTLQLFPLRSGCDFLSDKGTISGINASAPSQFFEFLPLKN